MSREGVQGLPALGQQLAGRAVEGAQELQGAVRALALVSEELAGLDVDPLLAALDDHVAVLADPQLLGRQALAIEVDEAGLDDGALVVELQQEVLQGPVLEVAVGLAFLSREGGDGDDLAVLLQQLQLLPRVLEQAVAALGGQIDPRPVAVGDAKQHPHQRDDEDRDEEGVSAVSHPALHFAIHRHRRLSSVR